jgi:hypothetical protein
MIIIHLLDRSAQMDCIKFGFRSENNPSVKIGADGPIRIVGMLCTTIGYNNNRNGMSRKTRLTRSAVSLDRRISIISILLFIE